MKQIYTDYLELPAPLHAAEALLRDPTVWAELLGNEQPDTLWRIGADLYTLTPVTGYADAPTLRWVAVPAAGYGPYFDLVLTLHDAVVSTHVAVKLSLSLQKLWLPLRGAVIRRRLRQIIRTAANRLAAVLRTQETLARAPARLVDAVVTLGAGASTALETSEPPGLDLAAATPAQLALVEQLYQRYPQTVEQFLAMNALDHLERVVRLEQGWERIMRGEYDPLIHEVRADDGAPTIDKVQLVEDRMQVGERQHMPSLDYDLIYAGAGLGLLHAAVMVTRYNQRVLVFDRSEVGCVHREWNISREELQALVDTGVVTWADLDHVVMQEYRDGVVRFFNRPGSGVEAPDLWMPGVLNVALDAGALLRLLRDKLEQAGATVLSGRVFRRVHATPGRPVMVEVELEDLATGVVEHHTARLLLDGMGSTSPLALLRHQGRPFAGVCPTVGTVAAGFAEGSAPDEVDLTIGDILISVADAQRGEQLMWEGFPGRDDELTVYLFYYSTVATAGQGSPVGGLRADSPRYSLLDLFEQYFTLLPTYKRPGPNFHHVRPVYGFIPGRHSLRRQEAPLLRGVLPVGDSAAQQSPLTFCGFGSHVRNLGRTTALLSYALHHELLEPDQLAAVNAFQTNVSLNWAFSRFMHPWDSADDVNRLQNIFLQALIALGHERATRFYRDRMRWGDYNAMLRGLLRRWPGILVASWDVLGARGIGQWTLDYSRFSAAAVLSALARLGGTAVESALSRLAENLAPAAGLHVRAAYEEWRAMGWV